HVVGLERRVRVVRVDVVGHRGRQRKTRGAAGQADDDRGAEDVEFHFSTPCYGSCGRPTPARKSKTACARPCRKARSTVSGITAGFTPPILRQIRRERSVLVARLEPQPVLFELVVLE